MGSSAERSLEHTITLTQPLPSELADELRRRIYFLDERIVAFDLVCDTAAVRKLCVRTAGKATATGSGSSAVSGLRGKARDADSLRVRHTGDAEADGGGNAVSGVHLD